MSAALIQRTKAANFLPIWSCSVWGLPCPRHYCRSGALLPHLFTLTLASPPRRYVFCGTFRPSDLNLMSRTLSGTLLCGVRTFLSSRPKTREATVRSGCLRESLYSMRTALSASRFCRASHPACVFPPRRILAGRLNASHFCPACSADGTRKPEAENP